MRLLLPLGLLTATAIPLVAMTAEEPAGGHEAEAQSHTIEKSFSFSFGVEDDDHGDHGDHAHGADGAHGTHGTHGDDDHEGSGVIELDMAELTGGQVMGHLVLDIGHMMGTGNGPKSTAESDIQISMMIEDDNGRRVVRQFGNGGSGGRGGMPGMGGGPGGQGGMPGMPGGMGGGPGGRGGMPGMPGGMVLMMNDDPMMMPPGAVMGMTGFHGEEIMHIEREMEHLHAMLQRAHEIIERQFEMIEDEDLDPGEREELHEMSEHWFHEMGEREHEDHGHEDHDQRHDEFMQQADSFIHKISMSKEMAASLSSREALAVFGVWQAREHMSPEQRVEMLTPIMTDTDLWPSVRNAASWVVMEALAEMHRESDAHNTLRDLIRSNGSKKMN
ncbi:MAG: hypothetical protein P8M22_04780 [Phycisphaerales bacterium]|nr:hypothetical protein [Phycisphaerales bacterium]